MLKNQELLHKCRTLAEYFASDSVQQNDADLYIAAFGSFQSSYASKFDLENYLGQAAKKSDANKVFLISGESGSGKSLFGQALVQKMAINYSKQTDILPLFISLPAFSTHRYQLLPEVLTQHGFTQEEIDYLKIHQKFFVVLDAYDEIHATENLYLKNHLDEWQVQLVISCRTSYLADKQNYHIFFTPYPGQKAKNQFFEEIFIAPFTSNEIKEYIKKYLIVKQTEIEQEVQLAKLGEQWREPKIYKKSIKQIPNLKNLIKTPFLLRITMEVLPTIYADYAHIEDEGERIQMTGVKLYDAFINRWFARQEERLIIDNSHPGGSLQKAFKQFATKLAQKMYENNLTYVTYEEESDLFAEEPAFNEWSPFFSEQFIPADKNEEQRRQTRIACKKACPLRKEGANQYGFIHASLIDHFVTQQGFQYAIRQPGSSQHFSYSVSHQPTLVNSSNQSVEYSSTTHSNQSSYLSTESSYENTDANLATKAILGAVMIPFESLITKRVLGQGSYGKVVQGIYQHANVAIKQLNFLNAKNIKEFKREAIIMMALRHPHTVHLYGVCLQESHYYIVMEYMPGGDLSSYLKNNPIIPWDLRWQLAIEIGSGMAYLHSQEIVHCDLKSLNVFLDAQLHAKVGDFGMSVVKLKNRLHAEQEEEKEKEKEKEKENETFGTSKGGTYPWMAPELFDDNPRSTKAVDVYAYGMVLWEILAGTTPFKGYSAIKIAQHVYGGGRETIPEDTPNFFAKLIRKCWAQNAEERPTMDNAVKFLSNKDKKIKKFAARITNTGDASVTDKPTRTRSGLPTHLPRPYFWTPSRTHAAQPQPTPLPGSREMLGNQRSKPGNKG